MSDERFRNEAVEPQRSVIVQAPAGSGKTTLLVERYLGLLAVVDAPEEILAITFTRKAAAEMKHRVLRYLDPAFETLEPHEQAPLAKARAVHDKVVDWGLLQNPQRLLIRTIDSFNHYLARTMPVVSALGPVPAPADNTQALYRLAARNVLALVDDDDQLGADLDRLLDWRDHRSQDIEDLLADLLAKREQWLRVLAITGPPDREQLEGLLETVVISQLETAGQALAEALARTQFGPADVVELLQYAAENLLVTAPASAVTVFATQPALPGAAADELPLWKGLGAALLLSEKAEFRARVDVRHGFPPRTPEKARFEALLQSLKDHAHVAGALHMARRLPEPAYSDAEWSVLAALVRVLKRTANELGVIFARRGQTDFTGLAAAALRGLGDEETGYTDLGLYLDQRIRHILVDEFQDTNWSQLHLLEKLTAGWQPTDSESSDAGGGDGRSLFLVGDPMQSIYRFREAEVGLFMRTRDQGIGALTLESKRLTRNFRSRSEIVHWVNQRLGPIFPTTEDVAAGAVAYAHSEPGRSPGGAVTIKAFTTDTAEGDAIADLLQQVLIEQADSSTFTAAIIVRARSHLRAILPALTRRGVAYRAVKLDPLTERPVVQDLLALTRVILQPADVTALLAVLRSPVCGLTLADLHALAGDGRSLRDADALDRLSADGRERAGRVFAALAAAHDGWRRRSVRELVEGVWHGLGGPACCSRPATDLKEAAAYLQALDQAAASGQLDDWNDFRELLDGQFTEGDPASDAVKLEILTMHGAKGLEWDLVVLPGLNRRPSPQDSNLLYWLPFTAEGEDEQVLLAPLRAAEEKADSPLVTLIRNEQRTRAVFENQRLLYVAATRAREQLVLSASLTQDSKNEIQPAAGSLLADLWKTTSTDFETALEASSQDAVDAPLTTALDQTLHRVQSGWRPDPGQRLDWKPALPPREREVDIEFNWAGLDARRTGTVLHRLLERVGSLGIESVTAALRARLTSHIPALLRALGSRGDALQHTTELVRDAFERTLDSETGQWLLSNRHRDAACELRIAGVLDGQLVNAIVDRTFIDAEGVRWIIDYKSGYHAGSDLDAFLLQERERYQAQLERYRRLFEQLQAHPVRTALYLPRHGRLI